MKTDVPRKTSTMDNTSYLFALFIKRIFTVRVLISTAVLAVSLFSITDIGLAQTRYTLTDLGTLGGAESRADGINDFGQVVGSSGFGPNNDDYHAFLWENGAMNDLGTLGGRESFALDINMFGQVVGASYLTGGGNYRAFVWDLENGMEGIGSLGVNSVGRAINNAGQVAGNTLFKNEADESVFQAFLSNPQDGMQDLGTLGGQDSLANGINRFGQVVGNSEFEGAGYSTGHAFLWKDSEMTDLGLLGGEWKYSNSSASDINDYGQVVGYSAVDYADPENSAGVSWHAFLWEDGEMADLGAIEDSNSGAYAINNTGQAVGYSGNSSGINAVLWDGGEMHNLNDLIENDSEMRLACAYDINNHGQIVGRGYIGDNKRAFLLTPVPEPASLVSALIGVGAIGLIAAAQRRRRQG